MILSNSVGSASSRQGIVALPDTITALNTLSAETVRHTAQTLTAAQQMQARVNIGAQKQITISTVDLEAGVSPLATGEVYLVYE